MMRKILWTALVTALTSLASALAVRAATEIWRVTAKGEPPRSRFANLFVRNPIKKRIFALLHAAAP
jgi:hypothetical protein